MSLPRPIKFRAKAIDGSGWVYGGYNEIAGECFILEGNKVWTVQPDTEPFQHGAEGTHVACAARIKHNWVTTRRVASVGRMRGARYDN